MPLEFLDAPQGVDAAAQPESPAETPAAEAVQPDATPPAEPVADAPPRGPDGKFIAKAEAQAPSPAPDPAAPPPAAAPQGVQPVADPAVPPGLVPIAALQEVREELRATKAEIATLKRQPAQQPPAAQPAPTPEPPDRYADPDGYEAWRDQQLEFRLFNERCNVSERFARTQFGDDLVNEAKDWATRLIASDPLFNQRLWSQSDPYGFAVAEYRKEKLFSGLKDDDFAAFQAWRAQQGQPPAAPTAQPIPQAAAAAPAAPAPAPQPAPSPPPKSLASAPSAGGPAAVPVGPGHAFEGVFSKG